MALLTILAYLITGGAIAAVSILVCVHVLEKFL